MQKKRFIFLSLLSSLMCYPAVNNDLEPVIIFGFEEARSTLSSVLADALSALLVFFADTFTPEYLVMFPATSNALNSISAESGFYLTHPAIAEVLRESHEIIQEIARENDPQLLDTAHVLRAQVERLYLLRAPREPLPGFEFIEAEEDNTSLEDVNIPRDVLVQRDVRVGRNVHVVNDVQIDGDLNVDGLVNFTNAEFTGDITLEGAGKCVVWENDLGATQARLCSSTTNGQVGLRLSTGGLAVGNTALYPAAGNMNIQQNAVIGNNLTVSNDAQILGNIDLVKSVGTLPNGNGYITKNGASFIGDRGTGNTFVGENAGALISPLLGGSENNTALGFNALQELVIGNNNVAVGCRAGRLGLGNRTIAIGADAALNANSTADNIAIGYKSLESSLNSTSNIAIGSNAGRLVSSGSENTIVGTSAAPALALGSNNCIYGYLAAGSLDQANNNVIIGVNAASALSLGNDNIIIGAEAAPGVSIGFNNIIIGGNQSGTTSGSGRIILGGGTLQSSLFCNAALTNVGSASTLAITSAGQIGIAGSSRHLKENIAPVQSDESGKIYDLQPVSFNFIDNKNHEKEYGFIAEEVVDVMPELGIYDANKTVVSVKYTNIIPLIVHELQQNKVVLEKILHTFHDFNTRLTALEEHAAHLHSH